MKTNASISGADGVCSFQKENIDKVMKISEDNNHLILF